MIMAIAWGLIFATVITLLLVPALYWVQYKLINKFNFQNKIESDNQLHNNTQIS